MHITTMNWGVGHPNESPEKEDNNETANQTYGKFLMNQSNQLKSNTQNTKGHYQLPKIASLPMEDQIILKKISNNSKSNNTSKIQLDKIQKYVNHTYLNSPRGGLEP